MVDIATVRTLLRINRLTPESPRTEIETALRTAGYTEDDIDVALKEFGQGRDVPAPDAQTAPTAYPPVTLQKKGEASSGAPLWEKLLGWIGVAFFVLVASLYGVRAVRGVMGVIDGYKGAPHFINEFYLYGLLPGIGVSLVIMLGAFFLARATNVTRTLGAWTTVFLSWYAVIWFIVLNVVLEGVKWYAKSHIEEWASFAFGFLLGMVFIFVQAAFIGVGAVALVLGLLSYLKRPKVRTALAPRIVTIIVLMGGIGSLTYYSGVMHYPARAFKMDFFCYFVPGALSVYMCTQEVSPPPAIP